MRALLVCLPLALWSCKALDPLAADGRCGNHIVEPLADEDCDGRATPEGLRCGEVGENGACRYRCDADTACPTGWGCGLDGVCRVGDGRLVVRSALGFAGQSLAGDVDGDGRIDLLSFGAAELMVAYGDDQGRFSNSRALSSGLTDALPALARLDDDASDDLVMPLVVGTELLLGGDRRGLSPVPVTTAALGGGLTVQALGLRVAPPYNTDDLLIASVDESGRVQATLQGRETVTTLTDLPGDARLLGRQGVWRREGEPDRWAVGIDGARFVWWVAAECVDAPCAVEVVDAVRLPGEARLAAPGVFVTDADGDGDADLWATVSVGREQRLAIATQADGVFGPFELVDGVDEALQCEMCPTGAPGGRLAAIADLDGDSVGDLISTRGVYLFKPGQPASLRLVITPVRPWNNAVAADFNGDGFVDVAANRPGSIDIFVNSGLGFFNERGLAVEDVEALAAGDFDGDLAADLAYVSNEDTLVVLFSGEQRLPTEPVLIARLPATEDTAVQFTGLATLRLTPLGPQNGADFIDDLAFVVARMLGTGGDATPSAERLGLLQGSASRRMASGVPRQGRVFSGVASADFGEGPEVWMAEVVEGGPNTPLVQFSYFMAASVLGGAPPEVVPLTLADGCPTPVGYAKHIVTAPLGPDGAPRVVMLDTTTPEVEADVWTLWVLHRDGDTLRCVVPTPIEARRRRPDTPVVADLDGDGRVDVASLLVNRSTSREGAGLGETPQLVVWWGQPGDAPLSDPARFNLDLPAVNAPALAALRLGPQRGARLLITRTDGVDEVAFGADRAPRVVDDGGLVVDQARQLLAMDADGDGVRDLLLVEETETLVARQGVCGARDAALGQCDREAP